VVDGGFTDGLVGFGWLLWILRPLVRAHGLCAYTGLCLHLLPGCSSPASAPDDHLGPGCGGPVCAVCAGDSSCSSLSCQSMLR